MTTLDKIDLRKRATIVRLDVDGYKRRAFINIGILPGTQVEKVRISPVGNPSAYRVKGTIIALRNEDAAKIIVDYSRL